MRNSLGLKCGGVAALCALAFASGCKSGPDEGMVKRLSEASDKVVACKKEVNDLKNEVGALKRQVAAAMANPGKVVLQDPEIINLVADLRKAAGGGGNDTGEVKPSLDPRAASKVVTTGAPALVLCYERALKKNPALQYQAGVGAVLSITVKPQGQVDNADVRPNVDKGMTECIRGAVMKWKFPAFQGDSVTIEQKISLQPKT